MGDGVELGGLVVPVPVLVAAALTAVASVAAWAVIRLARARERVAAAWDQVATDLQRRHALVPRLLSLVTRHAGPDAPEVAATHHAQWQVALADGDAHREAAEDALGRALTRLVSTTSALPRLTDETGFHELQDELVGIEERLGFGRHVAANRLEQYQQLAGRYPTRLVARALRLRPCATFVATPPVLAPLQVLDAT